MQLGDHNSSVHVPTASQSSKSEPELLIERVRDVYSHLLPSNCTIFLQVKDEKWGGAFVGYFEGTVTDEYFQERRLHRTVIGSERVAPSRRYTVMVIQVPAPPQKGQF